jgi:tetratricopeptide (TPR) repeat protein
MRALRKQYGDDPRVLSALGLVLLSADAYARARTAASDDVPLVVAEAQARLDAGEEAAAVAACTDLLRRRPDEPAVLALRAQAYRRLAMWPSAAADLRKLHAARRDDEALLAQYVDALYRAGDSDGARRVAVEAAPRASPAAAHVLDFLAALHGGDVAQALEKLSLGGPTTLLAEVQLAAGRRDDAVATLRKRRAEHPEDAHATRLFVVALLDDETPSPERIAEARAAAASLPADAPAGLADFLAGRLLLAQGDAAGAAARLADAARAAPTDAFAALYLGESLFRAGRRVESLAAFRRAATAPGSPPRLRAIAASRLLAASYDAADESAAESSVREALRFAPDDADAAERLVELLRSRGAAAEAAECAEHALLAPGLDPVRATRLRLLAACARMADGRLAEAGALLERLPPDARSSPEAGLLRGFVALGGKRFDAADAEFAAVLAADPKQSAAQLGRIEAALDVGGKVTASELYADWRAKNPDDRAFAVTATRFFLRAGHASDAAAMIQVASNASPSDPVLGEECARTLVAAGRRDDAVAAFRAVAARVPADARAACELRVGAFMLASPQLAADALALARRVSAATTPQDAVGLAARVLESEALLAAGKLSEAEVAAQAVVKRWDRAATPPEETPLEARVRFVLGTAASAAPRRQAEAVKQLSRCLALAPWDESATNNLASLLGRRSTTAAEGAALAKKLTARRPEVAEYWDTRAACSAGADDKTDAETAWRRALELFAARPGGDPAARARAALRFARFLAATQRADEARGVVKPALEYAKSTPEEAEIRRFLAELGGA